MRQKTTRLDIEGAGYEIRRLNADVGSHILMKLIGAGIKGAETETAAAAAPSTAQAPADPGEMARALAMAAFLRGLDFDSHQFIYRKCLACCSRCEGSEGKPIPICNGNGEIADPDLRSDFSLVMRLVVETLVFNFSDFFAQGGMGQLMGQAPASDSLSSRPTTGVRLV